MTGWITAEVQAHAADIADAIDGAGQLVTIRRPGQVDQQVRALVFQEDGKRANSVATPRVQLPNWSGYFKPDAAPLLALPFTVITAAGEHLIPDAPPQDVAEQGVLITVSLSPMADRARVSLLTFTTAGPLVRDPATGNMRPSAGPPVQAKARLSASDDPRIRDMAGADAAELVLVGRWGTLEEPQVRPSAVKWGSTSPLVVDGQNGMLTIKVAYPDPDVLQEAQLGGRFVATWKSSP